MKNTDELQDRIQSTNALIAEHERAAVEVGPTPPRSLLANIRALEKLKRRLEKAGKCGGTS